MEEAKLKITESFSVQDNFNPIPENHSKPRVRFSQVPKDIIVELLYFKVPFYLENGTFTSKKKKICEPCIVLSCEKYAGYEYV